jgi:ubiquinone/menaquinone biosynthesis C-methylase UbiE
MMTGGAKRSIFDESIARNYEGWYESEKGRLFDKLEKDLILKLIKPRPGQRILDIGCGTGHHLIWFKDLGLTVIGVDNSPDMLNIARKKVGKELELKLAGAKDLPFADKSFEIATMITTLEFLDQPAIALKEALRVSKDKVFLGVLNRYSLLCLKRKIRGMFFKDPIWSYAKFFSLRQLARLVKSLDKGLVFDWQTVIPNLPNKNPFGAFIGVLITRLNYL